MNFALCLLSENVGDTGPVGPIGPQVIMKTNEIIIFHVFSKNFNIMHAWHRGKLERKEPKVEFQLLWYNGMICHCCKKKG